MRSLILATGTRYLVPMLLLFSAFLLLRGHHLPGGGFVAGLVAAAAFAFHGFAFGTAKVRRELAIPPLTLLGSGVLLILGSAMAPIFAGKQILTGIWGELPIPSPWELKFGTPFFFEIGLFLVVTGSTLAIILNLWEAE